ncbi:amidohydrolase family protein [Rudaea sp.]|uniref:amidohydrolase family protein n=1 Tax=Rudaea sp. TaxID=2136325 RepID=UPI002ED5DC10
MMVVDAHQHFWRLSRGDYTWLTPDLGALHRDFEPADLAPLLAQNGVAATVAVQAAATEEETHFLLDLAREHAFIKGVVGWTDFDALDVSRRIAALVKAGAGKLKGLRPMIQDIADPDWVARPQLDAAFATMIDQGLVFDALVRLPHLGALLTRLQRQPQLRCVIDHAGKPEIAHRAFDSWARQLERLAGETSARCKLSGLLTEAAPGATVKDLAPYVEHVFSCFGPERVLWGSDWPVLDLASDYSAWFAMARNLVAGRAAGFETQVFGANAASFYRLDL